MKNKCGIYFLIKGNKVIYVGKTTRYPDRPFVSHHISKKEYDLVKFIEYPEHEIDMFEQAYIKKYKPINNLAYNDNRKKRAQVKRKFKTYNPYRITNRMKLRKLTLKSVVGFGKWRDRTVGNMISAGKHLDIISMYYKLSHITFFDEILDSLGVTPEWRIDKPGVDPEKYYEFAHEKFPEDMDNRLFTSSRHNRMQSKKYLKWAASTAGSKARLRSLNQGPKR